ncbi:Fc.00g095980.m01.CDS01 [Cosmosporella sp. VM-42]
MNHAPRASQLSGSTAFAGSSTSLSSLSSAATIVPQNGGPVIATANIINQKADASRSLYQICISLKQRLGQVPGFQPYLDQLDPLDPVDPLWNLFKTGYPLLDIYNSLRPTEELKVEDANASESKKSKIAIFKFVQACMKELRVPPSESFVITDLMGNDTSGFVKVTQVVNYVLDLAEQGGHLMQLQPYPEDDIGPVAGLQMTYRDHIVKELVDTERKYVQDLENLHDLKKTLEQKGDVPGDQVHQIFLNINAILDFQRRFLIRVETTNSMSEANQRWGAPFIMYEDAFDIYQPFIANQRKAAQIANQVFDKIQLSEHPVATDFNTLDGFLLKPMQRLVKYPLLLKDLNKKTEDPEVKADLLAGSEAAERVLHKANDAVNRDLLDEAFEDLISRVDDWKNHKAEQFGKLLLHGVYGVITGKTDQEKDYEIYLFECILLCCKEISPNKSKDKKDKTRSQGPKARNRNARLQLKGRIFMTNVTDVVSLSKPGSHSVQIWWKGDPGVENFTIKFLNEEMMKKWAVGLETQRKDNAPRTSASPDAGAPDFVWNRDQAGGLENPYLQQDEEEDDEDYGPATAPAGYPIQMPTYSVSGLPRTASSNNLRQRAGTGESSGSLASMVRAPPPRFPLPAPPTPLSLQTQNTGAGSPGARGGDSYFSPVAESPASSRTSTASGMFVAPGYPFPKSGTPQPPWEDHNRYTAPAMPRAPSRDGPSPNPHMMNGRNPRGPSLPVMASNQTAAQQQRSRSYSTPDINGPGMPRTRQPSQGNIPAVPGIPQHLHPAHDPSVPRSQTGSPSNNMPIRAHTQSPGAQRERMHQHSGSLGGTMAHFPVQPVYSRQNTPGPSGNPLRVDAVAANSRTVSPALGTGTIPPPSSNPLASPDMPLPTQLKVRVNTESGNYVTLVVGFNITYQSLIDRIDAKLARFTNSSIGKGMIKLRYRDEDGDFVTIESDDDIQIAFMEWREGVRNMYSGGVGEIELFCVGDTS